MKERNGFERLREEKKQRGRESLRHGGEAPSISLILMSLYEISHKNKYRHELKILTMRQNCPELYHSALGLDFAFLFVFYFCISFFF